MKNNDDDDASKMINIGIKYEFRFILKNFIHYTPS